jgi:CSLREA domain-containing protein
MDLLRRIAAIRLDLTGAVTCLLALLVSTTLVAETSSASSVAVRKVIKVDSLLDAADQHPGDGTCKASPLRGGGGCTLRAAIQTANAKRSSYVIALPAGTLRLTIPGGGEDKSSTGDLDVTTANLTLLGKGPGSTTVDATGIDRVLDVAAFTNVTVKDVRIMGGDAGGFETGAGGGIRVRGALTLERVVLESNSSVGYAGSGGGIYVDEGAAAQLSQVALLHNVAGRGAGLSVKGRADLTNVTIAGNNAYESGGGIEMGTASNISLLHVTITGNTGATTTAILAYLNSKGGTLIRGKLAIRSSIIEGRCTHPPVLPVPPAQNIVTDTTCGQDEVVADPGLLAMRTKPDGVPTVPLSATSPAIDNALTSLCPQVDARGVRRPQGAGCDSGAYERTS